MAVATDRWSTTTLGAPQSPSDGNYIRVKDIFDLKRSHLPEKGVPTRREPDSPDDCRIITQKGTQQYHFLKTERWISYESVLHWRLERRKPTSHTVPPPREFVFAPVKIVIAEHDAPIRAVLTFEPVCPTRHKMGVLRQGVSLWFAYAALAMLNSAVGQGLYQRMLLLHKGRSSMSDGLSMDVLKDLPVAAVGVPEAQLERVAHLSYQVTALFAACEECQADLEFAIVPTRERLLGEVCILLGLAEEEARDLIATVSHLKLADHPKPDPQLVLFYQARDIPPLPPVDLLTGEQRQELHRLNKECSDGEAVAAGKGNWPRLRCLHWWEDRLTVTSPQEMTGVEAAFDPGPTPFPIESIRGIHLPATLVRETVGGEPYEYYELSEHIVAAPGVCGGRATFKYSRVDVRHVLSDLERGVPLQEIAAHFGGNLTLQALEEAHVLSRQNPPEVFERPLVPAVGGR